MKLRIAVCEDEEGQRERLSSLVKKWGEKSRHGCEVETFFSAEAFLFAYEENRTYDILLLDIEMGKMSGVSLARQIRRDGGRAEIIFTTSHFEFFGEGYEVDALHYLMKPISEEKLHAVLSKAAERLAAGPPSLIVSCDGETFKLFEADILYIEALRHDSMLHTKNGVYRIRESISVLADRLSEDFYCTHRSYLVSLKQIVRISRTAVYLDGKTEIPLARGKYEDIHRAFIARN